jgi:hypothetical protein
MTLAQGLGVIIAFWAIVGGEDGLCPCIWAFRQTQSVSFSHLA